LILSDQGADEQGSAAWSLHRVTYLAVNSLLLITRRKLPLIRSIAEESVVWPAFISQHGDFTKGNAELMEDLNLGKDHFFRFTFPKGRRGKRWSFKTPANLHAVEMIKGLIARQCACRAIERDRLDKELKEIRKRNGFAEPMITFQTEDLTKQILDLPPLSTKTVNQWFDAAWRMVLEETEGRPEKNAQLRAFGAHRKGKTIAANLTANLGSKTSESNIRDGIKERLKKAFTEVVSHRT